MIQRTETQRTTLTVLKIIWLISLAAWSLTCIRGSAVLSDTPASPGATFWSAFGAFAVLQLAITALSLHWSRRRSGVLIIAVVASFLLLIPEFYIGYFAATFLWWLIIPVSLLLILTLATWLVWRRRHLAKAGQTV